MHSDAPPQEANDPQALHLRWHPPLVSGQDRQNRNGHRSLLVWLTGLPSAGKSTLAHALEHRLFTAGMSTYVLDGDNIRHGLCRDLGFSSEARAENLRRIGETARLFLDAGIITLAAFISPHRSERRKVRERVGPDRFLEIYCRCPLEVCESRDVKGNYAKARAGIIPGFTGISAPYEPPEHPDLVIDTAATRPDEAVALSLALLQARLSVGER